MKASIYTYPWDLADEGLDAALDNIQHVAGLDDVALATSYHTATYFLPHNPVRKLYYGEDGMVLFQADPAKYKSTAIKPRVSEVVDSPDYLERQAERIRERGLSLTAWIVYAYDHYLARTYPAMAQQDSLGNRHLSHLCVGAPDVRQYFLTLTEDILERLNPDAIHIESLNFLPFGHGFTNPKVLTPITPWCSFLMGLCMCAHCIEAASADGVDGEALRSDVAQYLNTELPKLPSQSEAVQPVTPTRLAAAFGGQLRAFLEVRSGIASSLFEDVVRVIRSHGDIAVQADHLDQDDELALGLSVERVAPLIDRSVTGPNPDAIKPIKRKLTTGAKMIVQVSPSALGTSDALSDTLTACKRGGAGGFAFYNYGLMRVEHLRWLGRARGLWKE
ncbi:MAG: hypothetical protein OTJ97_02825 [SAR202 cluster bacterium]|nr:hypothetical protein [SAR202 cluster bacterium]